NGRVIMMNPAAERFTGPIAPGSVTIAERARRPWFFRGDAMTPIAPDKLQLHRSAHGEVIDDEEVLIRRPGYPQIWVSATGRPLRDEAGIISGAVLVLRDVTERKKQEAALRVSEHHYKDLAESHLRLAREV